MKQYVLSLTCILYASCGHDVRTGIPKQRQSTVSHKSTVYVSMGDIQIPVCDESYTTAENRPLDDTLRCKE